jgi:large subunit ribosomal protein L13
VVGIDVRLIRAEKGTLVRTYSPKPTDVTKAWHVVDAEDIVLGRLATEVARLLRGKHKPIFAPHLDTGDHVIVVNAAKIVMTSNKADQKMAYRHSGYPGALTKKSYAQLLDEKPEELIERAVRGMLPKGTLGRQQLAKLKVYAGPNHPHSAQMPVPHALPGSARRAS